LALECLYFGAKNEFFQRIESIVSSKAHALKSSEEHVKKSDVLYKGVLIVQLDEIGQCNEFYSWLLERKQLSETYFDNSIVGLIVKSDSDYYTKKFSSTALFLMNQLGARSLGHSVVEFIDAYANLKMWQIAENLSREAVIELMVQRLIDQMTEYGTGAEEKEQQKPKILVLHAGTHEKSNTLALWRMVKEHIDYDNISEFHVEEGTAIDCYGCSFDTCTYYSLHKSCFYGGVITEELLPLIEESDVIVWICPNYNDAISAKLTAVINRLTVLYRRVSFKDKKIYSLIVSANSGSDSVASQLIDALVINKGFQLPPRFALMALASEEGSIYKVPGIEEKAKAFAEQIMDECL